jgi:hypothetical protein
MKTIHRTLQRLALAAFAATAFLSQAEAAPVVTVTPATQTIGVGGNAAVDIIVSGLSLTDPTGGFSLTLGFNNSFVSGVSFFNDPGGKMGLAPLEPERRLRRRNARSLLRRRPDRDLGEPGGGGRDVVHARHGELPRRSGGPQPADAVERGALELERRLDLAGVTAVGGEICVSAAGAACAINAIPEPETVMLLAAGLAALALRRRRKA